MAAAALNLTIEQGTTFRRLLTFKDSLDADIDLTGQTFRGSIRRSVTDATAVAVFTFVVANQISNTGEVTMTLSAAASSAIVLQTQDSAIRVSELFAYDVERVFVDGSVERVLQGVVTLVPEATKE